MTDIVGAARRHLPALILPALVFTVASAAALRLMPGEYMSSAIVIPEPKTERQTPLDVAQLAFRVRQQVTDRVRIEKLIGTLDLYRDSADKSAGLDSLVARLCHHIRVDPASERHQDKSALTISYSGPDPETARRVNANLVEQLIAEGITSGQDEISGGTESMRKRTLELSSKLLEFEKQMPVLLSPKESQAPTPSSTIRVAQPSNEAWRTQMNLESLNDQLYKLGQQIADLNSRIAVQRQVVEELKKGSALNNNPTYALLITKRTELQGQRDNLINRQELTEKHPRVLAIIDQITAINNQVEEIRRQQAATVSQTPEARELLALEADRRKLQLELEVTGREVKRRTASSQRFAGTPLQTKPAPPTQRSADSTRLAGEYLRLKQEYSEAVIKLQDAQKGASVGLRLLEPASLPQGSDAPNGTLIGLIAAAAGLVVGACLAFGLDGGRRRTVQNAADVEYYTRLPLLAVIPRTSTEQERRRLKRRSRTMVAFGVAVTLAATVALIKLHILTEAFSLISNR